MNCEIEYFLNTLYIRKINIRYKKMANTAALLGNLLNTNADINYYTQQSIFCNAKYEANSAKLEKQVKYEEKWEEAFDTAMEGSKECKVSGVTFVQKDQGKVTEATAEAYANAKVDEYNEELSIELADLDIEYDTMVTMYDALLEQMRAQQESEKQATSAAAQDTGLLQS